MGIILSLKIFAGVQNITFSPRVTAEVLPWSWQFSICTFCVAKVIVLWRIHGIFVRKYANKFVGFAAAKREAQVKVNPCIY